MLVLALAFPALLFGCAGSNGNGKVCASGQARQRPQTTELYDGYYTRQSDGSFVKVAPQDDDDPDDDEIEPGNLVEGDVHDWVDETTKNVAATAAFGTQDVVLRARQNLRGPEGVSQGLAPAAPAAPVRMVPVRRTDANGNVTWAHVALPSQEPSQNGGGYSGNGVTADVGLRQNYSDANRVSMDDAHGALDLEEHQTNAKWREDLRQARKRRAYINDARAVSREIRSWRRCWR